MDKKFHKPHLATPNKQNVTLMATELLFGDLGICFYNELTGVTKFAVRFRHLVVYAILARDKKEKVCGRET